MTMDISRLAIEVQSKGIKETSDALGGLSRTAANLDKRVESLTDKLSKLMNVFPATTLGANNLNGVLGQISTALQQANASARATATALQQVTGVMGSMTVATRQNSTALLEQSRAGGTVITTFKAMATAFAVYTGLKMAHSIVEAGDAWTLMQARLTVVTGSMNNARVAQEQLFDISQRLRTPLEANAQLYTRMFKPLQRIGKESKDVAQVVEGVGLSMKLSGSTAAEMSSAMLQLSQSFNSGRLNGAEFSAVAEAAPLILEAIADEMNRVQKRTDITTAQLKKMGSEGKIGVELMANAIQNASPKWKAQFDSLPLTVNDAMTRVTNAWTKAMGELNQNSGLNKGLAEAIRVVEDLIPAVRDELTSAFVAVLLWVKENKKIIGEIWDQTKGLVKDVWELGSAFGFVVGQAVGAGDSFSVIGFAIYAARLGLAGLQDGFTLIGGAALKVGAMIWKYMVAPLATIVPQLIGKIIDKFSWLTDLMARVSGFIGLDKLSGGLKSIADAGKNASQFIDGVVTGFKGIGTTMDELGTTAIQHLSDGKGAVQALLNEQKNVTFEMQKQGKFQEKLGGKPPSPAKDPKGAKEAAKHQKAANTELEQAVKLYKELALTYEKLNKYGLNDPKLTKAQLEQLDLETKLAKEKDSSAIATLRQALAVNLASQEIEKLNEAKRTQLEAEKTYSDNQEKSIEAAQKEAKTLQDKIANYGLAADAVEGFALQEAKLELASMSWGGATEAQILQQQRLVDALQAVANAKEQIGELDVLDKIEKLGQKARTFDFGSDMAESFGKAGKAIDKAGKSLDAYGKRNADLGKRLRENSKLTEGSAAKEADLNAIRIGYAKSEVDMYGDMAGAVKGFFKEKTLAYKLFDAFETGLRIVQIALAWQEAQAKIAAGAAVIAAKTVQSGSSMALDATEGTASIGWSLSKAAASTTAGVAKAFEQLGVWGFVGAGAIIAFMASMGVGGGGGAAGGIDVKERQRRQNTGTVFGDDEAKSESLKNAMETVAKNTNIGLEYSANMVVYLRNIDNKMGSFANSLIRARGMTTGSNFGIQEGTQSGGGLFGSGLFGSKTSTSIQDVGLIVQGTIAGLEQGRGASQYADVRQEKKTWYGKTSTSQYRQFTDAGSEFATQIGDIFSDVGKTIVSSVKQLGGNFEYANEFLNNFGINFELSLKGLTGSELREAVDAAVSGVADQMAVSVFGQLRDFQKVGEGYYDTLVRVAYGTEQAQDALKKLGVSAMSYMMIQDKQGDVGTEMVRASLMVAESGTTLGQVIRVLDGSMEDLVATYKVLTVLRNQMKSGGLGSNISLDLIRGAGGVNELDSAMGDFFDKFYSDTEKQAMAASRLEMEFARVGRAVPKTREEFRDLVSQLIQGDAAAQELAGRVLSLSGLFDEAMTLIQETDGKAITDAKEALRDAYDDEAESLENVRDKMRAFSDSLKQFRDGLIMGDLSTKSEMEKYQTARARYIDVSDRAQSGDETAIAEYEKAASEFLTASRNINASGANYTADYERVLAESAILEQWTSDAADTATAQLDALTRQVDLLIDLNETAMTVAQAISQLVALQSPSVDGSHANGLDSVPFDGYVAELHKGERVLTASESKDYSSMMMVRPTDSGMVEELRALRTEVQSLKEEQRVQTQALIAANYDANEQNASMVNDGTRQAATDAAYAKRTKLELN